MLVLRVVLLVNVEHIWRMAQLAERGLFVADYQRNLRGFISESRLANLI